ncbi:peroxiredoxin [Asticcacaulis sp. DW145]|jgi:thioredoxin-dependent peroxiredoxin|uniref:thioredoxin-dependent peroxiredoxin n=1 Tax=Asticcacaulis currens TaxID=2984210 RepID=A0ABT5IFS2_9CAUL|nr:peroxiredoxin [Asticcacaulis currens]MDC7695046.1 peroxiredoxin [Asticcacaulis currens]BEV12287.1 peroxiredoxin [Asticcacaulis sp. DW145]
MLIRAALVAAAFALTATSPALAALKVGDKAPDFKVEAATNGETHAFSLKSALKQGPVIVYFYPKAFTGGCSLEARQFSENMDKFAAKKISVVGLSADDVPTLKKFSKADCGGKFPVGSDKGARIAEKYDAKMPAVPMSGRVSYIIGKDGKIAFVHDSGNAATHVPSLLAAADSLK